MVSRHKSSKTPSARSTSKKRHGIWSVAFKISMHASTPRQRILKLWTVYCKAAMKTFWRWCSDLLVTCGLRSSYTAKISLWALTRPLIQRSCSKEKRAAQNSPLLIFCSKSYWSCLGVKWMSSVQKPSTRPDMAPTTRPQMMPPPRLRPGTTLTGKGHTLMTSNDAPEMIAVKTAIRTSAGMAIVEGPCFLAAIVTPTNEKSQTDYKRAYCIRKPLWLMLTVADEPGLSRVRQSSWHPGCDHPSPYPIPQPS